MSRYFLSYSSNILAKSLPKLIAYALGKRSKEDTFALILFKPFQPSVAFHMETRQLICILNRMAGFYIRDDNRFSKSRKLRAM